MGLWLSSLLLGLFCWLAVSNFDLVVLASSCSILSCLARLSEACYFFMGDIKVVYPEERGGGEELRGIEGGEAIIRVYYVSKESILSKWKYGGEWFLGNRGEAQNRPPTLTCIFHFWHVYLFILIKIKLYHFPFPFPPFNPLDLAQIHGYVFCDYCCDIYVCLST